MYSNHISQSGDTADNVQTRPSRNGNSNWYMAMARAWGTALDRESQRLAESSLALTGDATIGDTIKVSALAHKLSFLSTAASTASNSAGQALETLARKQ